MRERDAFKVDRYAHGEGRFKRVNNGIFERTFVFRMRRNEWAKLPRDCESKCNANIINKYLYEQERDKSRFPN